MAYTLSCDNGSCGSLIQSGEGQPALPLKARVYCNECQKYVEQVEAKLRAEMVQFAHEGVDRLKKRRAELMAQMMPESRGGSGEGSSEWPQVG